MESTDTLLLKRNDIASLLKIEECMNAVEEAFSLYAKGKVLPPKVLGLHNQDGGIHVKAGMGKYFVTKVNANFSENPKRFGLPTIQGVIVLNDSNNGRLLALMDTIELTIIRTGAATGIAAKWLAPEQSKVVTICGCGNQGRISLKALMQVRKIEQVFAFDLDPDQVERFAIEFQNQAEIIPIDISDLNSALRKSKIIVSCTSSKKPFIHKEDILPGAFIAAVGADHEDKQELFPSLLAVSKVVTDLTAQCATMGELHHAIKDKLIKVDNVYAELGEIIAGQKAGRNSEKEIIIFDSTGTALQDVAAASIVYEKALALGIGSRLNFSEQNLVHV